MFFDPNYMLFVFLPTLILSLAAQAYVAMAFNKWSKTANGANLTGVQVFERLTRFAGLGVGLEGAPGERTDHYDPRDHTVRLSQSVAAQPSVASMAVVAHELGHAQQHQENSILIQMRNFLVPAVQFSPQAAILLIFGGLLLRITDLIWAGVLVFGLVVIFMILTLPVEIDASMRGLRLLRESGLMIDQADASGSREVLTAAALTYVAAAVTALLQLLYYVSLARRR
jgi:uncharacterized protein